MTWTEGAIEGCQVVELKKFADDRGWLAEIFRRDELDVAYHPAMGYLSMTKPGVTRGPHEHDQQADLFVFFNGQFRLFLWDTRKGSRTEGYRQMLDLGEPRPASVIVPPGVVHAYRNTGATSALILNCPNALYAGWGRKEPVDEIRHEDKTAHRFTMS